MKSVPRIISRLKYLDFWQNSKNSWKLWHVFVMSTKRRHRQPANQTYKFAVKCSRIFRWRKALSSKLFQGFHVAKCDSELNNEALLSKIFALNFFLEVMLVSLSLQCCYSIFHSAFLGCIQFNYFSRQLSKNMDFWYKHWYPIEILRRWVVNSRCLE